MIFDKSSILTIELGTHTALALVLTKVTTAVLSGTLISISFIYYYYYYYYYHCFAASFE